MDVLSISQRTTGCTVGREAFSVPRRSKQGWKHRRIHYAQRFTSDSDGRSLITTALDVLLCCDGELIIKSVTKSFYGVGSNVLKLCVTLDDPMDKTKFAPAVS